MISISQSHSTPIKFHDSSSFSSGHFTSKALSDSNINESVNRIITEPREETRRKVSPSLSLPVRKTSDYSSSENIVFHSPQQVFSEPETGLGDSVRLPYTESTIPVHPVEPLIQPSMITQSSQGRPRLFYAEPFTRLDSRPASTTSGLNFPAQNSAGQKQYQEVKSVRILPTDPILPHRDIPFTPSQFDNYHMKPKKWRLTHIKPTGKEPHKLPKITLVKYKLEGFSNNFIQEEEKFSNSQNRDGRRSASPPPRRNSLVIPGRRLSLVSGKTTQIFKILESTPLTPVAVAPDITQFLFPHEVQALSTSTPALPRIESMPASPNKIDMSTQTDKVSSSTQTDEPLSHEKRPLVRGVQRAHAKSHRLASIGEDRAMSNRIQGGYVAGGRTKRRSSSVAPSWKP